MGTHFFITRPEFCYQQTMNSSMEYFDVSTLNFTGPTLSDAITCNLQFIPIAITSLVLFGFTFSVSWRDIPYTFIGIVTGFYQDFESTVRPYTAWWVFAFVSFIGIFSPTVHIHVLLKKCGKQVTKNEASVFSTQKF